MWVGSKESYGGFDTSPCMFHFEEEDEIVEKLFENSKYFIRDGHCSHVPGGGIVDMKLASVMQEAIE